MKTATKTNRKNHKASKTIKTTNKTKVPAAPKVYTGKPISATKVYVRRMTEFKNCKAECYMILNEVAGTVTYANAYNDLLKASYDPATYTYPINEKVIGKKLDNMKELEVTEWPEWIINVGGKKRRNK